MWVPTQLSVYCLTVVTCTGGHRHHCHRQLLAGLSQAHHRCQPNVVDLLHPHQRPLRQQRLSHLSFWALCKGGVGLQSQWQAVGRQVAACALQGRLQACLLCSLIKAPRMLKTMHQPKARQLLLSALLQPVPLQQQTA